MKNTTQYRHVSVCRAHNRPSFNACFIHPQSGKRINAALRTRDEAEAKARGAELQKLVNTPEWWNINAPIIHTLDRRIVEIFFGELPKGMSDRVLVPKKKYPWMYDVKRSPDIAKERLESAKIQRDNIELKRELDDLRRENMEQRHALGKHVKETISEAVDAWKIVYKNGHAEKTFNDAVACVASFVKAVKPTTPLATIKAGDIDKWLDGYSNRRTNEKVSPRTKQRVRAYVSCFFTWANRRYDLPENPMKKTGSVPGVARTPDQIKAIRNESELTLLIDSVKSSYWKAWVAVACLAGPRWKEQRNLKVSDVFLDNGYILVQSLSSGRRIVDPTKTGKMRRIPIEQTTLLPILKNFVEGKKPGDWLFPSLVEERERTKSQSGQWNGSRTFLRALRPELKKARKQAKGKGDFWGYGPKEFRHCFGTAVGHSGFTALEISRMMGNSADVAERHYIGTISIGQLWKFKWR